MWRAKRKFSDNPGHNILELKSISLVLNKNIKQETVALKLISEVGHKLTFESFQLTLLLVF